MAKSPEEMTESMIRNYPEKTGRPFEEWLKLTAKAGFGKHGEIVKWLKTEHGMGHGFANLVAARHLEGLSGAPKGGEDLVAAQYSGDKAALLAIHDAIVKAVRAFGKDVDCSPKKTYVSLRRSKQFAIVQPSTRTRVDLGINLGPKAPAGRLEASGSFNAMVSHRVKLSSVKDVDAEVVGWLKEAYLRS